MYHFRNVCIYDFYLLLATKNHIILFIYCVNYLLYIINHLSERIPIVFRDKRSLHFRGIAALSKNFRITIFEASRDREF